MKKVKKRNKIGKGLMILLVVAVIYMWTVNSIRINDNTQTIEVGHQETTNIQASLFGIDITKWGKQTGEVNLNIIGEYQLEYEPYWTTQKYQKTVKVVDRTDPEFIFEGDMEIVLQDIDDFEEPGYKVIDNYDGDITDKVTTEIIKYRDDYYEVIYYVGDSSDNVNIKSRTIHIIKGTIYLTFDDGPSFDITPRILNILKENNIKATFFVVGYGKDKEELIKREYTEGHSIGIHGFSHEYAEIYTDLDTLMENFNKLRKMVEETTGGYQSKIIRFPGGTSNTVNKQYCEGIMTEAVAKVEEEGYVYFDWNVDSSDAGGAKTPEEVYKNVISEIQPGRNNIILMHDFAGNDKTLSVLQDIIDYCKKENYRFDVITQETKPIQHKVSN